MLLAAVALITLALADCDDIATAPSGDLYLACHSPSDTFAVPVVGQKQVNDEMDGYVIRLRKDTHDIVYAAPTGGSAYDSASRVAIDADGNAWVAGFTKSADFAVTGDAWQKTYGGNGDAFFVKLSPAGRVLCSTFLGGPSPTLATPLHSMAGNRSLAAPVTETAPCSEVRSGVPNSAGRAKRR